MAARAPCQAGQTLATQHLMKFPLALVFAIKWPESEQHQEPERPLWEGMLARWTTVYNMASRRLSGFNPTRCLVVKNLTSLASVRVQLVPF